MMIQYFDHVEGVNITFIPGQTRYAFSLTDSVDFYDLSNWGDDRDYQGDQILFYDLEEKKVYAPFGKQTNILYGEPLYCEGGFYFLQGDYNQKRMTIYRWNPGMEPVPMTSFNINDLDTYNLRLMGDKVYLISQNDTFICYYPEKFSFDLKPNEVAVLIENEKVYINAWVEEGWDMENERAGDNYRYYEKLLVRDFQGNLLKEEVGSLCQMPDGTWWIS